MKLRLRQFLASKILLACVFAALHLNGGCNKTKPGTDSGVLSASEFGSKRIYFIYGALLRSISVADVGLFAERGIANGDIGNLLQFGRLDPENLRSQLTREYVLDLTETSNILNSPVGEAILGKLGSAVRPHLAQAGGAQAVRSAVIRSLEDDNKLTIVEVLRNLPANMDVDVQEVLKLRKELGAIFNRG